MARAERTRTSGADAVAAAFSVPSELSNARRVAARVAEACAGLGLSTSRAAALRTAVAEAVANAIEHGNAGDPSLAVHVSVHVDEDTLMVRVRDHGCGGGLPARPQVPDIDAKLRGEQGPRGWGLFLIRHLVDELRVDAEHHAVELVLRLGPAAGHGVRSAGGCSASGHTGRREW